MKVSVVAHGGSISTFGRTNVILSLRELSKVGRHNSNYEL